MAINVPTTIELLDGNQLLGAVPAGREPLDTLLDRTNHLYAYHAPALVNVCPRDAYNPSKTFILPIDPSADGLDYDIAVSMYAAAGTVNITVSTATTYGGTYTALTGWNSNNVSVGATGHKHIGANDSSEPAAAIPAAARFLKFEVAHATADVQVQAICVTPRVQSSIASGAKASGFIAFDNGLLSSTGAPINTEHLNRGWANIASVYNDRRHALMQWCQHTTPPYRFSKTGSGGAHQYVGVGQIHMPGNIESTCKVRVLATDAGTGTITVGQKNGASVVLDADGTDQSADLQIVGAFPLLYAMVNPDSGTDVVYLSVTWAPTVGTSTGFVTGTAPPARLEYLSTLDAVSLYALHTPYATSLHTIDVSNAQGTYHYWYQPIAPGSRSMRQVLTRSYFQNTSQTLPDSEVWSVSSGLAASNEISVPAPAGGLETWPPKPWSAIVHGTQDYLAPGSTVAGDERQWVLAESRTPAVERFWGRRFVCVSGETTQVADLSAV